MNIGQANREPADRGEADLGESHPGEGNPGEGNPGDGQPRDQRPPRSAYPVRSATISFVVLVLALVAAHLTVERNGATRIDRLPIPPVHDSAVVKGAEPDAYAYSKRFEIRDPTTLRFDAKNVTRPLVVHVALVAESGRGVRELSLYPPADPTARISMVTPDTYSVRVTARPAERPRSPTTEKAPASMAPLGSIEIVAGDRSPWLFVLALIALTLPWLVLVGAHLRWMRRRRATQPDAVSTVVTDPE